MSHSRRRGSRVLAVAATLAVAAGSLSSGQAARATTGDPVLLNEALLSHTGADTAEFVELYGTPGASLAGLTLLTVEGDSAQSPGTVAFRLDFASAAHLGGNGFYLVGNAAGLGGVYGVAPDTTIGNETFANGSQTLALVDAASAPAVGSLMTGSEVVHDAVGVTDAGPADQFFFGVPPNPPVVVGPDPAGFMAPGLRRSPLGSDTDTASDWVITSNNLDATHTPTPASPYNFPPTAACGAPLTTVAGTSVARPVSATDVDGTVVGFAVAVSPDPGSMTVANVVPATGIGGTATADVAVSAATPAGNYEVTVTAMNADATPQLVTCQLAVTVEPAPVEPTPTPTPTPEPEPAGRSMDALHDLLAGYIAAGDVAPGKAHLLTDRLVRVERFLAAGQDAAAVAQLHAFANQADGLSPRWLTPWAAGALAEMADALAATL